MATPASTQTTTMTAIVADSYGSADVLAPAQRQRPSVGAKDVLIRVHAAGVHRGDWHLMAGLPYLVRLGYGLRGPKQPIPGTEVAGTVVAVGAEVTRFQPGDEVLGIGTGTFAEYATAPEAKLVPKPADLPFPEAAVVPVSGPTALQAVRDHGQVGSGQRVLITGASGGVGSFAVQIAKAAGAHVTGVASGAKADFVRGLGADRVIDYRTEDVTAMDEQFDLIVDLGGNTRTRTLRRLLAARGTLVIVGGESGGRWTGGFGRGLRAALLSPFVSQRLTTFVASEDAASTQAVIDLVASGKVRPALDQTFPLERAADAMRALETGTVRGKVALVVVA
jgi:NADPH:quinone reductase-like Zn-dependent oxidoreductase